MLHRLMLLFALFMPITSLADNDPINIQFPIDEIDEQFQHGNVVLTPETKGVLLGDGAIVSGTGGERTFLAIQAGATVTLNGVNITAMPNDDDKKYSKPAIWCATDATIVLAEGSKNYVRGGYCMNPGIRVGLEGSTLTIRGKGSLEASSYGYAPGIGSCYGLPCGNIVIEDGDITATSGVHTGMQPNATVEVGHAVGIGAGIKGTCGNISILGGTVRAKSNMAAAIGASSGGTCGSITISKDVNYLEVGTNSSISIGPSVDTGSGTGTCGTLTIGGVPTEYIDESSYIYKGSYTISFNRNSTDGAGIMPNQDFYYYTPQALTANSFTRTEYNFTGWNTKADGSGTGYADGETVDNLGNVTLYAQWQPVEYHIVYNNLYNATNNNNNPTTYTIESNDITLAEPTTPGFTFDGWTYEGQDVPTKNVTIPHGSTGNKHFTANWTMSNPVTLTQNMGNVELYNGHILTGTGGPNTHVTISNGATVTLSGVNITDIPNDYYHQWAGITCLGDATIILADGTTNNVTGGLGSYPGIQPGSQGKTLTIQGTGTLNVTSRGAGAGIGSGYYSCGNIILEGGIITATGGQGGAAIGDLYCGGVTISDGVSSLTAIAGENALYTIGIGNLNANSGKITIGGKEIDKIFQNPFTYIPSDTTPYTVTFNANGGTGSMNNQIIHSNSVEALSDNAYSREGYAFMGWNTKEDGSGADFSNGQRIINQGNITLYAQWQLVVYNIIYNLPDGTNNNNNLTTYTIESNDITLAEPTCTGFTFDGWTYEGQDVPTKNVTIPHGSTGDKHFTANWTMSNPVTLTENIGKVVLHDGHILTGTGGAETHVTISDGATITLRNVNITDILDDNNHMWAGITCLGDATIILEGDNTVKGGYYRSGIQAGPTGTKLTICGSGTLVARGSSNSAGIGSAVGGSCGDIDIAGDISNIQAERGSTSAECIGKSKQGSCGTVFITPGLNDSGEGTDSRTITGPVFVLTDSNDNANAINQYDGQTINSWLSNRTLWKDGNWNTLCLPFNIDDISTSPLADATIKELDGTTSNFNSNGILTLNFTDATSIEAGKPYIIKWSQPEPDLVIKSEADWNNFATGITYYNSYQGKLVKLDADINVSMMAGGISTRFKGIFDGGGHTITLNLEDNDPQSSGTALFSCIDGATIMNLKVDGSINISGCLPATFAADVRGNTTIKNCWSNVNISSSHNWAFAGAMVSFVYPDATLNINNCAFTGSISYSEKANIGGGMIANTFDDSSTNLTRCLFAPSTLTMSHTGGYVFASGQVRANLTNCYYNAVTAASVLNKEGIDASEMSNTELLTALGNEWEIVGNQVVPNISGAQMMNDITNPVFTGVTINSSASTEVLFSGGKFIGTYSPVAITANDQSILFLGAENKLYYPTANMNINSCRAYFQLNTPTAVKEFILNFGEDDSETGLTPALSKGKGDGAVYDLSGRKVNCQLSTVNRQLPKGINIVNGKKVLK